MKRLLYAAAAIAVFSAVDPALAAEQRVTLQVDNMFCASCPYIVKQTLASVPGVNSVGVSFKEKTAIVVFDDSQTNVAALTTATADVGFPSRVIE